MGDTVGSKNEDRVEDYDEAEDFVTEEAEDFVPEEADDFVSEEVTEEPKSELNADKEEKQEKQEKQLKLNVSMRQDDIEAHIFRANLNNVNFKYFEL